jgi:hypothetical protein
VSDSVVHDPPPQPRKRTLDVRSLKKNNGKPAPVIDLDQVNGNGRRVTRSMVQGPVIDLTHEESDNEGSEEDSEEDSDYDILASPAEPSGSSGLEGITAEDMDSESPVIDDLDQEPPPEAFTSQEDHMNDELTDEQRYIQALMQAQSAMNNDQPPNDEPPAPPPVVEPVLHSPEDEQVRFNTWLHNRIHVRSHKDVDRPATSATSAAPAPQHPATHPAPQHTAAQPTPAPLGKPKCFINFYYTIGANSYLDPLENIKKAAQARMLAVHPDKMKPGEVYDARDVDIITFIRRHVFNNDENRERYNRLIASPYYAHGSGDNTDIPAMTDYMEHRFDFYQPFTDLTVKNSRLFKADERLPRLYPSDQLPKAARGFGGSRYGGPVNISSVAQAFVPRVQPQQVHYGAFGGHMAAFNSTLNSYQPHN